MGGFNLAAKASVKLSWIPTTILLLALAAICLSSTVASASPLTDIPEEIANRLGVSDDTGAMIVALGVITSVTLALAALKVNLMGMIAVQLILIGLLTGIGFLPVWVLLVTGMIVALLFATGLKDTLVTG